MVRSGWVCPHPVVTELLLSLPLKLRHMHVSAEQRWPRTLGTGPGSSQHGCCYDCSLTPLSPGTAPQWTRRQTPSLHGWHSRGRCVH